MQHIIEHVGNLFDLVLPTIKNDNVVHLIVHGCNARGKMGSGFAKELRERFPAAYQEYYNFHKQYGLTEGTIVDHVDSTNLVIVNAITQDYYGYDGGKYVSYDAIDSCFELIQNIAEELVQDGKEVKVHFPLIGAGLAGGHWDVIESIINHRLTAAEKNLYILPTKD